MRTREPYITIQGLSFEILSSAESFQPALAAEIREELSGKYLPVKIHEYKDCSQPHNPFFLYFLLTPTGCFPEQSLPFDTMLHQVQGVALLLKEKAAFYQPSM